MKFPNNKFAATALTSAAVGASIFGAVPANAVVGCPTGSTEILPGICQIVFTADGTFTIPAGAAKLTAVLVGGGGGGYAWEDINDESTDQFGGGAGEVVYTDDLPTDGTTFTITIGAGGAGEYAAGTPAESGGATQVSGGGGSETAAGGQGAHIGGGESGNGNAGHSGSAPGGGGGASGASTGVVGGTGYTSFSAIPSIDTTLWPNNATSNSVFFYGIGLGGNGHNTTALNAAEYGHGGHGTILTTGPTAGIQGVVVIRFAPYEIDGDTPVSPDDTLANTGTNVAGMAAGAVAFGALGALAFAVRQRFARRSR